MTNLIDNPEYRKQREINNKFAAKLKKDFIKMYGKANTLEESLPLNNIYKLAEYYPEQLTEEKIKEILKND